MYQGSVIIDYVITSDTNDTVALQNVEKKMKEAIIAGTLNVGAPILDASITDVPVNFGGNTSNNNTSGGSGTTNNTNTTTNTTDSGKNETSKPGFEEPGKGDKEEKESSTGGTNMKQLAVILGIIFGILLVFGVVALVLYRLSKKNQKKTISTKPN